MKILQFARLLAEDFKDQAAWITKLLEPINSAFAQINMALNKGLTIDENFAGAIKSVDVDGTFPVKLVWEFTQRPKSVVVVNAYRVDGVAHTMTAAVQVQWSIPTSGYLQIDDVVGILPPVRSCAAADVDTAAETLTIPDHQYTTGMRVQVETTNTLPTGLSASTNYYVIAATAHTIKLATSETNATAGTAINITGAGTGYCIVRPQYFKKYRLILECKAG
jgi:hypothetical protein